MWAVLVSGFLLASFVVGGQDFCIRNGTILQFSPVVAVFGERILVVYTERVGPFRSIISGSVSTDGGTSFAYFGPLSACPECAHQGLPSLAVSEQGIFYVAYIKDSVVEVLRSSDGGKSFVPVLRLDSPAAAYPHIVADGDNFYVVWTDILQGKILLAGSKLPSPTVITDKPNAVFGRLLVFHDNLYCVWISWPLPMSGLILPFGIPDRLAWLGENLLAQFCQTHPASLWMSVSRDKGRSWDPPQYLAQVHLPWHITQFNATAVASFVAGGLEVPLIPALGGDLKNSRIYVAFPSATNSGALDVFLMAVDANLNIVFPPLRVGSGGEGMETERFLPTIAVSPQGTLGLVFYELDLQASKIDVILAQSSDGGQTFHMERVNSAPLPVPPVAGQLTRSGHFEPSLYSGYIGESIGIAADQSFFYIAWVDFRDFVVTPDYPKGRPDMDVYFGKLPVQR